MGAQLGPKLSPRFLDALFSKKIAALCLVQSFPGCHHGGELLELDEKFWARAPDKTKLRKKKYELG